MEAIGTDKKHIHLFCNDIVDAFEGDWPRYLWLSRVTDQLVKSAGNLATSPHCYGYDVLSLPSALSLRERVPSSVMFMAFDRELNIAAKREALRIHPLGA